MEKKELMIVINVPSCKSGNVPIDTFEFELKKYFNSSNYELKIEHGYTNELFETGMEKSCLKNGNEVEAKHIHSQVSNIFRDLSRIFRTNKSI